MRETVDIKAESLPWYFQVTGLLMIIFSLTTLSGSYWWVALILVPIGAILITYVSGTEIDIVKKNYREYNSILFLKRGEKEDFQEIEKIFINTARVTSQMHTAHTSNGSTFIHTEYNAYLKLGNGKKIFLTSRKNKMALISLIRPIANRLKTELVDYTAIS